MKMSFRSGLLVVLATLVATGAAFGFGRYFPAPGTTTQTLHRQYYAQPFSNLSPVHDWSVAIPTGGMTLLDANPISNFDADLVTNAASRVLIDMKDVGGTTLLVRVKYPAAMAAGSTVTIAVAGKGVTDQWDRLLTSVTKARSLTITTKATDNGDGTWKWTDVDIGAQSFDMKGSRYLVVGIEAIQTGTGANTAVLEIKGI